MLNIKDINQETIDLLGNTVKDFANSYLQKSSETDAITWLGGELLSRLNIDNNEAMSIGQEIVDSVDEFDNRLASINDYCNTGKTTEQWLRGSLIEEAKGKVLQEFGNYLEDVSNNFTEGNAIILKGLEDNDSTIEVSNEGSKIPSSNTEWNKFTLHKITDTLDQEIHLTTANALSLPAESLIADIGDTPPILPTEYMDEESNSELDRGLKIAAAGALTVVSKKVNIPFVSNVLPINGIVDIACWGVEGAKCVGRIIQGKINVSQGLECMKRATVSLTANLIHHGVGAQIFKAIPIVGLPLSMVITKVMGRISPQVIQEKIYQGLNKIAPFAKNVATGIVSTIKSAAIGIKETVANLFNW